MTPQVGVDDVHLAINRTLQQKSELDNKRVVLIGDDFGGFIATFLNMRSVRGAVGFRGPTERTGPKGLRVLPDWKNQTDQMFRALNVSRQT